MARDAVSKRMQEQLEHLIGNDPVHAKAAVEELAPVAASDVTRVTAFLQQHSDRIIGSFPAIMHLAQLFGRLGERGAGALVDCIRSGSWNAKLIAAHGCRYITEPRARGRVEGEMLHLLEDDDPDLVKTAIVALGELGAVMAASRVMKVVLHDEDHTYDLYALDCLLRLIAADNTDTFLGMRFGDFNELFQRQRNKDQALSYVSFTFPEWKGRIRNHALDLVVNLWVNSEVRHLRELGAVALGILRAGRTRRNLAERIQKLADREQDRDDGSMERLAFAWGCIGATDDSSLDTLEKFYSSENARLNQCAFLALAVSFPVLMTLPPVRRRDHFFERFVGDVLERPHTELTAYVLLGLGRRRQMLSTIRDALSSQHPLVRAGAALALAWSKGDQAAGELREFAANAHGTSFERLIAWSALTRFDPAAPDRLHEVLCAVPPNDLWHFRHGKEPPGPHIFNPHPWMREIIYALNHEPTLGRKRADAWAEVLVLDAAGCIAECKAAEPPRVFISYSWDDPGHRRWVANFAARLERDAIDTVLDQKDVALGERFGHFMERAVYENDFVLCICTPGYKARFDSRRGGVGTEADLMVPLFQANERKFIPLLRVGDWDAATPRYLSGKRGLDLRGRLDLREYKSLLNHFFRRD